MNNKEGPNINPPKNNELKNSTLLLLQKHGISVDKWGTGVAKTVDHLIKEISDEESVLVVESSGELVRQLAVAVVDVYYRDIVNNKRYKLIESKQIFKDGRQRERNLETSLAEKLKANEKPDEEVATRALEEELGIEGNLKVNIEKIKDVIRESDSYPGLRNKTKVYYFSVVLSEDQYNPEGYSEHQADKDNYFEWIED